ncbi:serine protease-like [Tropilaelaps mercedesae]|uniref:Serine protease-like n=1 Tax=Tropilaelaps mercedesae TaxID=418985 RepID=A0A1V9XTH5_9ACAR|nr:serine protease-like [Tropilaelaps mercedesae]
MLLGAAATAAFVFLALFCRSTAPYKALPFQFPWLVSLQRFSHWFKAWRHHCGGSIIDEEWIITTSRCLERWNTSDWRISLGRTNLSDPNERGASYATPAEFYRYENYINNGESFDYGLVRLDTPLDFTYKHWNLAPIAMPTKTQLLQFEKKVCSFVGWGKSSLDETILQTVDMYVPLWSDCVKQIGPELKRRCNIDCMKTMLCAEKRSNVTLEAGDFGSPLMCRDHGRYTLAGMLSIYAPDVIVLFTRASDGIRWMNQIRWHKPERTRPIRPARTQIAVDERRKAKAGQTNRYRGHAEPIQPEPIRFG